MLWDPSYTPSLRPVFRDFSGGPVVLRFSSLSMQGRAGLIHGQGTKSPNALWHGQKLKQTNKKKTKRPKFSLEKMPLNIEEIFLFLFSA